MACVSDVYYLGKKQCGYSVVGLVVFIHGRNTDSIERCLVKLSCILSHIPGKSCVKSGKIDGKGS
jgi:hypothetical protein